MKLPGFGDYKTELPRIPLIGVGAISLTPSSSYKTGYSTCVKVMTDAERVIVSIDCVRVKRLECKNMHYLSYSTVSKIIMNGKAVFLLWGINYQNDRQYLLSDTFSNIITVIFLWFILYFANITYPCGCCALFFLGLLLTSGEWFTLYYWNYY